MSPVPTTRAWGWGTVQLVGAVAIAGSAGFALGMRAWPLYAGFAALLLLGMGAVERLWRRRAAPPALKARGRLKVIEGGKARAAYDLSKDDSTNSQRYLM